MLFRIYNYVHYTFSVVHCDGISEIVYCQKSPNSVTHRYYMSDAGSRVIYAIVLPVSSNKYAIKCSTCKCAFKCIVFVNKG